MLVLSRKCGERIKIESSEIVVVAIQKNRVRIGIIAKPETKIERSEWSEWTDQETHTDTENKTK